MQAQICLLSKSLYDLAVEVLGIEPENEECDRAKPKGARLRLAGPVVLSDKIASDLSLQRVSGASGEAAFDLGEFAPIFTQQQLEFRTS